jgi:hypothetical protein
VVHPEVDQALPRFVDLAGEAAWTKRIAHLRRELAASPFRAKLAGDYHWLELTLADQLGSALEPADRLFAPDELAALYFAQMAVHVHGQLTPKGQRQLVGRLRDALQSNTGFASIFLEVDVARRLVDAGYGVEFADMDGSARYDLRFWSGATEGRSSASHSRPTQDEKFTATTSTALSTRSAVTLRSVLEPLVMKPSW